MTEVTPDQSRLFRFILTLALSLIGAGLIVFGGGAAETTGQAILLGVLGFIGVAWGVQRMTGGPPVLLALAIGLGSLGLPSCCALGPGPGYISRTEVAPSFEAVAAKFEVLLAEAVAAGRLAPATAEAWRVEVSILMHLVSGDPGEPVALPVPSAPLIPPAPPQ